MHPATPILLGLFCASAIQAQTPVRTSKVVELDGRSQELVESRVPGPTRIDPTQVRVLRSGPSRPRAPVPADLALGPAPAAPVSPAPGSDAAVLSSEITALRWAEQDGALWVRGADYKASFDADGATFTPFLGSDEPRNWPFSMRLAAAAVAGEELALEAGGHRREGDGVVVERGAIDEVYEPRLRELEQTFVVESLPRQGDLTLRVALATDLEPTPSGDGWLWTNDKGEGLRLSAAFLRLADGGRKPLATTLEGDELAIVVPQDLIASAGFPLVVDPVVSSFVVDGTSLINYTPDLAYHPPTDSWVHCYGERFSLSDSDVYLRLKYAGGPVVDIGYIEVGTGESWNSPRIAYNRSGDLFLVVATVKASSTARRSVRSRGWSPTTGFGPFYTVASDLNVDLLNPDVGGDPYPSGDSWFLVAWESNGDIKGRLVNRTGAPEFLMQSFATTSAAETRPSVSNSNGGVHWCVAWTHGTEEVGVARCSYDASNIASVSPLLLANRQFAGQDNVWPYLITYGPEAATLGNVNSATGVVLDPALVVAFTGARDASNRNFAITVVLDSALSSFEEFGFRMSTDQRVHQVCVDADDWSIAVAYTADGGRRIVQGNLLVSPGHDGLGFYGAPFVVRQTTPTFNSYYDCVANCWAIISPRIATKYSSTGNHPPYAGLQRSAALAWTDYADGQTDWLLTDILGATTSWSLLPNVESLCDRGSSATTPCPCGPGATGTTGGCPNSASATGAAMNATGDPRIFTDTLSFTLTGLPATTSCLFFMGTSVPSSGSGLNGTVFGDGVRCVSGSVIRLGTGTASAGTLSFPPAGSARISTRGGITGASTRLFQAWYRNSASFCTPSTFNLSNALRIHWLP